MLLQFVLEGVELEMKVSSHVLGRVFFEGQCEKWRHYLNGNHAQSYDR